jgi:hypothetical protein
VGEREKEGEREWRGRERKVLLCYDSTVFFQVLDPIKVIE